MTSGFWIWWSELYYSLLALNKQCCSEPGCVDSRGQISRVNKAELGVEKVSTTALLSKCLQMGWVKEASVNRIASCFLVLRKCKIIFNSTSTGQCRWQRIQGWDYGWVLVTLTLNRNIQKLEYVTFQKKQSSCLYTYHRWVGSDLVDVKR